MMRKLLLLLVLCLIVGSVSAQHDIFKKNGAKSDINVTSDLASVSYTNTKSGVSFYHTVFIDGSLMAVNYNSQSSTREIWGSGNGIGNSDILIQHDFDGTVNDTLKGTITVKTPHVITFPYTLTQGETIYPYENGFKITKGIDKYSHGIIITPPTAVNNTGGSVLVWYTYDASKITLNINDVGQEYPIVIDPSFTPDIPLGYSRVTSYTYNITSSMGAQTDYQMKFILSNASGVSGYYAPDNIIFTNGTTRSDWNDINATDGSNNPLPFWIENNTRTAYNITAWVKVPAIAIDNTSTAKWYYGNSSQTESAMNGLNTFPLWDDFNGASLNSTKWVTSALTTATVASGAVTIATTQTVGGGINGTMTYGQNYSVITRWRQSATTIPGYPSVGFFDVITNHQNTALMFASDDAVTNKYMFQSQNSGTSNNTQSVIAVDTAYHIFSIKRIPGSVIGTIDGANTTTITSNIFVGLLFPATASRNSNQNAITDWIAVRKSVEIEPITSLYSTSVVAPLPNASFTCIPTSTNIGESIACTDTSTGTPTNWTYYWGDGNITDGTQNPSYTYSFTGTFSINQSVNNTVGSSWYNRSDYITITNVSGLTHQDVFMESQKTLTLNFKSSTNGELIPVVQVYNQVDATTVNTTNGTFIGTYSFGTQAFIFHSEGYVSRTGSYYVDDNVEYTVQMVPSTASSAPVYNVYPPKDVKFHITSFFGSPIPGASVTIQGITTSTGNWDWLVTLLGISLDEVAINGTAMTESTDSNGDAVFLMLPSVKYNITTTATGYTFPSTIIAPQATEYTIAANWNESWFSSGNDTLKDVNVSVNWVTINSTHSFVNITYDDQTTTTTGGDFVVYREAPNRVANATPIAIMNITDSSCSNSTTVDTPTGGASYRVVVNATTTAGENIVRSFTHYFKGSPVTLPGWTSETLLWLALFIVIFTAAFAGAIHSPQMAIVLCVESWVFWAIGWLDALITQFWYGETAIIGILTLASFIALLWNITEGKSKVKRSS